MSEQLKPSHEHDEQHEAHPRHEQPEHKSSQPEKQQSIEQRQDQIESIKSKIDAEAVSGREIRVDKEADSIQPHMHYATHKLKGDSLRRSLKKVREELSPTDRVLSKAIHQPIIRVISEVGANTIARPKGVLVGSIVALLGSSYVLYTAKHYGFVYNYWIVFILFGGGYIVGLIIEFILYALRRFKKAN